MALGEGRHLLVDGVDVGHPVLRGGEPWVVDELGLAQCGCRPPPVPLGDADDRQPSVARLLDVVGRHCHARVPVPGAFGEVSGRSVVEAAHREMEEAQRKVDDLYARWAELEAKIG